MSQDGHDRDDYRASGPVSPDTAVVVAAFPMPAGLVFDWHTHVDHQLAWPASGVVTVRAREAAWVLPTTRALWIPAGVRHETLSAGAATMRSAYVRPARCPIGWVEPTPVSASPLMAELIGYLEDPGWHSACSLPSPSAAGAASGGSRPDGQRQPAEPLGRRGPGHRAQPDPLIGAGPDPDPAVVVLGDVACAARARACLKSGSRVLCCDLMSLWGLGS